MVHGLLPTLCRKLFNVVDVYYVYMSRLVQLSDEAYRRLAMRKRSAESFSDVILRTFPQGDLANLHKMPYKGNIRLYHKWTKRIDALDTPKA